MIAAEVKGKDPKISWEIVGIYRSAKEDIWLLEELADRNGYMGRTTKRIVIGGDLSLPYDYWNGHTQVLNSPTRGGALFDVYLVRPESAFTSCSNVHGTSNYCGVQLEVEWGKTAVSIEWKE